MSERTDFKKAGAAFWDALQYIQGDDDASLILVSPEGAQIMVERGNTDKCLKALLHRVLDKKDDLTPDGAEKASKQVERLLRGWIDEWKREQA